MGATPVGAGIAAGTDLLKLGFNLLAQHTARVKGATNENGAANAIVPEYDADIAEIVAAHNNGTASVDECIAACQAVDANVYQYLKSHVGPPGTAWDGSGKCTKTCTVGCCIYYNNLHSGIVGKNAPPYNGSDAAANGANGLIPMLLQGSGIVKIPTVYGSKYGLTQRTGYSLTLATPPPGTKLTGSIGALVDQLTGHQTADPLANLTGGASSVASGGGISSTLLLVLFVPFILILFLAMGRK